ncbi:uncharacterized protein [Bemisia tabaci]|uniref:uncharacterized protein isoform X2 n=2 Tax=Bemisia tabaci TaxID=7038 RepID=UPI003B281987
MDSSSPGNVNGSSSVASNYFTVGDPGKDAPPVVSNVELVPVSVIKQRFRNWFSAFPYFNVIQSLAFNTVTKTDDSIVVAAPTGSGKTVIFELAIMRLLEQHWPFSENCFKIVYMAPIKALCSERYNDWKSKFFQIGLKCLELTGDTEEEVFSIDEYHLILTTPEKWDSLTRKWKENHFPVQKVKLFMIDEVHLLNEEKRGPTLEAVVCRMKLAQSADQNSVNIRFIAVSATIPNVDDITEWLSSDAVKAKSFQIGEECRPVKLTKIVIGYPVKEKQSPYMFDISLNYKLKALIMKYAKGKPSLIFCNTRKGVLQTANTLSNDLTISMPAAHKNLVTESVKKIGEGSLKGLLSKGIGCHHAGLSIQDRRIIEDLFCRGCLPVLVTTSTLAMGINIPAHLVIIKSTEYYVNSEYQEYSESQVLQMIGRAGRPQFDSEAVAVIMTKVSQKERYENLIKGVQPVESNLHRHLTEHLNSEVVLRTIPDIALAMSWIRSTFLYVRTQKNPVHYKLPRDLSQAQTEKRLQDWCLRELNGLVRYKLALMTDGYDVLPTAEGTIMAQFCISFETMKLFMDIKSCESLNSLLDVLIDAQEYKDIKLRMSDRKTLNSLNQKTGVNQLRFPIKGKVNSQPLKINCLIQATLGCLQLFDAALIQERAKIFRIGKRLTQGLVQLIWLRDNCYKTLLSAILLAKCFISQLWENSEHVSRQLPGIGPVLSSHLVAARKVTLQDILDSNPRDLEVVLNRLPPFGNNLIDSVKVLPQFELEIQMSDTTGEILVEVRISNYPDVLKSKNLQEMFYLLVGNSNNNIIHKSRFSLDSLMKRGGLYKINLCVPDGPSQTIHVNLLSKNWVGLDVNKTLSDDRSISPESEYAAIFEPKTKPKSSAKPSGSKRKNQSQSSSCNKKVAQAAKSNCPTPAVKKIKEKFPSTPGQKTLSDFSFTPVSKLSKATFQEKIESIDKSHRENVTANSQENFTANSQGNFAANNQENFAINSQENFAANSQEKELSQNLSAMSISDSTEDNNLHPRESQAFQDINRTESCSLSQSTVEPSQNQKKNSSRDAFPLSQSSTAIRFPSNSTHNDNLLSIFNRRLESNSSTCSKSDIANDTERFSFNIFEPLRGKQSSELWQNFGDSGSSEVKDMVDAAIAKAAASWRNHPLLNLRSPEECKSAKPSVENSENHRIAPAVKATPLTNEGVCDGITVDNPENKNPGYTSPAKQCQGSVFPHTSSVNTDQTKRQVTSSVKKVFHKESNLFPSKSTADLSKYAVDDEEMEEFMQALHEDASKSTQSPQVSPCVERRSISQSKISKYTDRHVRKSDFSTGLVSRSTANYLKEEKCVPYSSAKQHSNPVSDSKSKAGQSYGIKKYYPVVKEGKLSTPVNLNTNQKKPSFVAEVDNNQTKQDSNYPAVTMYSDSFCDKQVSNQEIFSNPSGRLVPNFGAENKTISSRQTSSLGEPNRNSFCTERQLNPPAIVSLNNEVSEYFSHPAAENCSNLIPGTEPYPASFFEGQKFHSHPAPDLSATFYEHDNVVGTNCQASWNWNGANTGLDDLRRSQPMSTNGNFTIDGHNFSEGNNPFSITQNYSTAEMFPPNHFNNPSLSHLVLVDSNNQNLSPLGIESGRNMLPPRINASNSWQDTCQRSMSTHLNYLDNISNQNQYFDLEDGLVSRNCNPSFLRMHSSSFTQDQRSNFIQSSIPNDNHMMRRNANAPDNSKCELSNHQALSKSFQDKALFTPHRLNSNDRLQELSSPSNVGHNQSNQTWKSKPVFPTSCQNRPTSSTTTIRSCPPENKIESQPTQRSQIQQILPSIEHNPHSQSCEVIANPMERESLSLSRKKQCEYPFVEKQQAALPTENNNQINHLEMQNSTDFGHGHSSSFNTEKQVRDPSTESVINDLEEAAETFVETCRTSDYAMDHNSSEDVNGQSSEPQKSASRNNGNMLLPHVETTFRSEVSVPSIDPRPQESSASRENKRSNHTVESGNVLKQMEAKINECKQSSKNSIDTPRSTITGKSTFKLRTPWTAMETSIHPSSKIVSGPVQSKRMLGIGEVTKNNADTVNAKSEDIIRKAITPQSKVPSSLVAPYKHSSPFANIGQNENGTLTDQFPSCSGKNNCVTLGQASRVEKENHSNGDTDEKKQFIIRPPKLKAFSLKFGCQKKNTVTPRTSSDKENKLLTPQKNEEKPKALRSILTSSVSSTTNKNKTRKVNFGSNLPKSLQSSPSRFDRKNEERQKKAFMKMVKPVCQQDENFTPIPVGEGLVCTEILGASDTAIYRTSPRGEADHNVTSMESFEVDRSEKGNHHDFGECHSTKYPPISDPAEISSPPRQESEKSFSEASFLQYSPEMPSQPIDHDFETGSSTQESVSNQANHFAPSCAIDFAPQQTLYFTQNHQENNNSWQRSRIISKQLPQQINQFHETTPNETTHFVEDRRQKFISPSSSLAQNRALNLSNHPANIQSQDHMPQHSLFMKNDEQNQFSYQINNFSQLGSKSSLFPNAFQANSHSSRIVGTPYWQPEYLQERPVSHYPKSQNPHTFSRNQICYPQEEMPHYRPIFPHATPQVQRQQVSVFNTPNPRTVPSSTQSVTSNFWPTETLYSRQFPILHQYYPLEFSSTDGLKKSSKPSGCSFEETSAHNYQA